MSTNLVLLTLLDSLKRTEIFDFNDIVSWYVARRLPAPEHWHFSTLGWIVPGVAAGFLYVTNSGIALVDGFITNPEASSSDRIKALKAVSNALLATAYADKDNIKKIVCHTSNQTTKALASELGFEITGDYSCVTKKL